MPRYNPKNKQHRKTLAKRIAKMLEGSGFSVDTSARGEVVYTRAVDGRDPRLRDLHRYCRGNPWFGQEHAHQPNGRYGSYHRAFARSDAKVLSRRVKAGERPGLSRAARQVIEEAMGSTQEEGSFKAVFDCSPDSRGPTTGRRGAPFQQRRPCLR